VVNLIVKVLINAVAVAVATMVVPNIHFDYGQDYVKLLGVALILALINTYLKPILRLLSFPITLVSLGLFALVLNALLLLLVALVSDQFSLGFTLAGFPPTMSVDAFVAALLGSIVISVVSMVLGMLDRGRRIVA
jgi:putative membrane protein